MVFKHRNKSDNGIQTQKLFWLWYLNIERNQLMVLKNRSKSKNGIQTLKPFWLWYSNIEGKQFMIISNHSNNSNDAIKHFQWYYSNIENNYENDIKILKQFWWWNSHWRNSDAGIQTLMHFWWWYSNTKEILIMVFKYLSNSHYFIQAPKQLW